MIGRDKCQYSKVTSRSTGPLPHAKIKAAPATRFKHDPSCKRGANSHFSSTCYHSRLTGEEPEAGSCQSSQGSSGLGQPHAPSRGQCGRSRGRLEEASVWTTRWGVQDPLLPVPLHPGGRGAVTAFSSSELGLIQAPPGGGRNPGPISCWRPSEGGILPGRTTRPQRLQHWQLLPWHPAVAPFLELWRPTSQDRGAAAPGSLSPSFPSGKLSPQCVPTADHSDFT